MPTTLNDIIDLSAQQEFDFNLIESYGCRPAPCMKEEITINRATEYMLVIGGKPMRVYNWEQSGGDSRMYIKDQWGTKLFLTEDAVNMLTYGKPSYEYLTPVAQSVKVAA